MIENIIKNHFKNISQLNQFSAFTQHILLRLCWLNWIICVNGRNHLVSAQLQTTPATVLQIWF